VTAHLRSDQSICEAHDAVGIPPHGSVPSHLLLSSAITSGGGLSLGESRAIRVVWPCGQRLGVRAVVVATWDCIVCGQVVVWCCAAGSDQRRAAVVCTSVWCCTGMVVVWLLSTLA